jgi:hypothetical protein
MSKRESPSPPTAAGAAVVKPVIDPALAAKLDRYKGRWVAVDQANRRIIASADSAVAVVEAARAKQVTDPLVLRVPVHPERPRLL